MGCTLSLLAMAESHRGTFQPAKCETELYGLGSGPGCTNKNGSARGSVGGAEYTVVNEVWGLVQKCRLGQSIWPAKPKMSLCGLNFCLDCTKQSAGGVWGV